MNKYLVAFYVYLRILLVRLCQHSSFIMYQFQVAFEHLFD